MLLRFSSATAQKRKPVLQYHKNIPCAPDCLSLHQLAQSLGNAVDARDTSTYNHSEEVAEVSRLLARLMALPPIEVEMIHIAAHLHDIGKIGLPDAILKKPGQLSTEEWLLLRQHPEMGAKIVKPVAAFCDPGGVADIILHHHEHYDGSGYPSRLSGMNIPIGARIVAVADTLSAMMQNRLYRQGTSFDIALKEIVRCNGNQFDPAVVRVLLQHKCRIESLLLYPSLWNSAADQALTGS